MAGFTQVEGFAFAQVFFPQYFSDLNVSNFRQVSLNVNGRFRNEFLTGNALSPQ
jgi:hypothetical protein